MQDDFSLEAYDYTLPQKNIAQHPSETRDSSRLLVLDQRTAVLQHRKFSDVVDYFNKGDILVVNDTKVFPARLQGRKETGGKVEIFLLHFPMEQASSSENHLKKFAETTALIKSSKRPAKGSTMVIDSNLSCTLLEHLDNGQVKVQLEYPQHLELSDILSRCGAVPLPPYIERSSGTLDNDRTRYQTVYAQHTGAVAAPTAGLHFTEPVLETLHLKGVEIATLTLHVGYGTFAPVRTEIINEHVIHQEYISISKDTAVKIQDAKTKGGKVWAVGTTTVRALEFAAAGSGEVKATEGWCDLYIIPGFKFQVIDNLITNFHLPKSSLLFLVSALCGRKTLMSCYNEAIARDYRFYSYGDAMAIIG
jgi:S-adenosylmethionine:tRNA ribosyltransferase-isomerase